MNICSNIKQMLPTQPCVLCGAMSHDGLWCNACDGSLPYLPAVHCPVCAMPLAREETCGQCLTHSPLFTGATAAYCYSFPLDKLIQAMKYGEQFSLAHAFAGKLLQRIDRNKLPDLVIPMPLHPLKLRERGFNQSQLLAAYLADELGLELLPQACRRVRNTLPQSTLTWDERRKNVHNAFCCDADLGGKRVVLVDDVLTSGATLNALAAAVLKRGAYEVSVWVVARTVPHYRAGD